MTTSRARIGRWGGVAALASLLLAPVSSVDARVRRLKPAPRAADAPGFGAFTPAAADPRIAASFARSGLGAGNFSAGAFRFTPSGATASRRAITVAVRARAVGRVEAAHSLALASSGLAPTAFSLGASLGWRRFALSGDVAKVDGGLLPIGRESADLGLSFSGRRWATKLDVAGERAAGDRPLAMGPDQSWSVGLGGSYSLTRNLDLTGGVRYKAQREELMSFLKDRREGQAVYLGTTFRF